MLYTDHANAFASVVAVARAFPLFSLKSKPESSLENVELEVQLVPTQEVEFGKKIVYKFRF